MRFLIATSFIFGLLTSGCTSATSSSQQTSIVEAVSIATPKPTFDQAAIETLNARLSEDVRQILEQAEDFEIIALKPGFIFSKQKVAGETLTANEHWRFAVVAKTKIMDSTIRAELMDALYAGVVEAQSNSRAMCFAPRHAIRATSKGKTVELVICFECYGFLGSAPSGWIGGVVTEKPRELFNRIYTAAGLEIQP